MDGKPAPVLRGRSHADHRAAPAGRREVAADFRVGRRIGEGRWITWLALLVIAGLLAWPAVRAETGRMPERALVVVPTYNERVNLPLIVPQILAQDPRLEVLVVDDNSPDGTGASWPTSSPRPSPGSTCSTGPERAGLGKAYLAGFRWALEHGYDLIFEMDADFSHDPKFLPTFLERSRAGRSGHRARATRPAST